MISEKLDKIRKAIKQKNIYSKAICWVLIKMGLSNEALQALEVRNKNFQYLKKNYSKYILEENLPEKSSDIPKVVWICWFQGLDKSPLLVKKCFESVQNNLRDWEINLVTEQNMFSYINFPEHIVNKWKKGIITNTNLSDMLRNELLIRYGGLWLDATVFISGKIPAYITETPFFLYTHSNPDDKTISYNSWLIYSQKENPALVQVQRLMYQYWLNENTLREYFLWHLFITLVNEKNPDWFSDIPFVTDELPETLARVCTKTYDGNYWRELKKMTSIHKLTNKIDFKSQNSDTYYERIIGDKS